MHCISLALVRNLQRVHGNGRQFVKVTPYFPYYYTPNVLIYLILNINEANIVSVTSAQKS